MYHLVSLDSSKTKDFESLTFQHLLPRFREIDKDSSLIAIGADSLYGPIGLVLADIDVKLQTAEILSIFVKSDHRQKGIGTALLSEIESYIHGAGCETMKLAYYSGKTITPVLEALLNKEGWSNPIVQTLIYKTDMKAIVQAPWIRKFNFPKNMHAFLWSELSKVERDNLRDSATYEYPPYLSPFKNEQKIDSLISLGLRSDDRVVGWSLVHRVSEDTLLYNSLYVESHYQHVGCAITLLASSIQLQLENEIPYGMFAVNSTNPVMKRLIDRWFEPYTIKITEMYATFKSTS